MALNLSLNDSFLSQLCRFEPVTYDRFLLIMAIGTPFGTIGLVTNILLVVLFLQKKYRNSPTLYLAVLALLDFLICLVYLVVFTVDAISIYFRIYWLWEIWHGYAMLLFTVSRIVQLSSAYLVLFATLERFLMVGDYKRLGLVYSPMGRRCVIVIVMLLSISLRLSTFWEYVVVPVPQCREMEPFMGLQFLPKLARSKFYFIVYNFYFMEIVRVFIPFCLLVILNVAIVVKLREKLRHTVRSNSIFNCLVPDENSKIALSTSKRNLKAATFTILAIVTTYLICNSLDLFVKTMERLAPFPVLETESRESTEFYRFATDIISILFAFNSFIRLFIYLACNREFRRDLCQAFCKKNILKDRNNSSEVLDNVRNDSVHQRLLSSHQNRIMSPANCRALENSEKMNGCCEESPMDMNEIIVHKAVMIRAGRIIESYV